MFYMMVANVIMLNILIAMFNHRYEYVQAKSHYVHSYQRYLLTMEYIDKPLLPPPFLLFNPIISTAEYLHREYKTDICHKPQKQTEG